MRRGCLCADCYKADYKASNRLRYWQNRVKLTAYLLEHPCVDCGERDIDVLVFDHHAPKVLNVSSTLGSSWNRALKEIARCTVRCANCHMRRHKRESSRVYSAGAKTCA